LRIKYRFGKWCERKLEFVLAKLAELLCAEDES
jgi:hypothetical protein